MLASRIDGLSVRIESTQFKSARWDSEPRDKFET